MYYGSEIKILVSNTKTNEAEWVDFPICKRSLETLKSLNIRGKHYEISGAAFEKCYKACDILCRCKSLDEINFFARLYYKLTKAKREEFRRISESGCFELNSIGDLINLISNLDKFYCIKGISTYEELCAYYAYFKRSACPIALSKQLPKKYFKLAGQQIAEVQQGGFSEGNYYFADRERLEMVWCDGFSDVPKEYMVRI